jgi:hypothetical protein
MDTFHNSKRGRAVYLTVRMICKSCGKITRCNADKTCSNLVESAKKKKRGLIKCWCPKCSKKEYDDTDEELAECYGGCEREKVEFT